MYDLVIENGTVIDGTGAKGYEADVAVMGDKIVAIGDIQGEKKQAIDAKGLVVSPGFIDLHSHADFQFFIDSSADSKITQGVTLEYVGNCGLSFCAPLSGLSREDIETRVAWYETDWRPTWTDFAGYMDALGKVGKTLNVATQVGHGTVRAAVIGFDDRGPTTWELERMQELVADGLDAGALGFSTGLYYAPGSYARTDEVVALAGEAAKRGKLYSTHMRDESDYSISLFGSVEESFAIGRLSGVRVQISHLKCVGPASWGRSQELLERIDKARSQGIDVAADQYPYTASSTSLSGGVFPRWALAG